MTPVDFRRIRTTAGFTQAQLASFLRIESTRAIRYWETGQRPITGPVSLLMELLDGGVIGPLD